MQNGITKGLQKRFHPTHLEVINECEKYNLSKLEESHFKVVVVSDVFEGLSTTKVIIYVYIYICI